MGRKIKFSTVSLGSQPDMPEMEETVQFVKGHKGEEVDIKTFLIDRSLSAQKEAEIKDRCGGGHFLADRIKDSIKWDAKAGFEADDEPLSADARYIASHFGDVRSALPAPVETINQGGQMDEEAVSELCSLFKGLLREMRDKGTVGHIIIGDTIHEIELELLRSPKNLFFLESEDQDAHAGLLEFQSDLILKKDIISFYPRLAEEYDIRRVWLIDPDEESLNNILEYKDPDEVLVAGYGVGDERDYWRLISDSSQITG